MNQKALLQIAEKLERLAGRLPSRIRKAVLSELTPLKELFLKQRPPRILFIGSSKIPTHRIIDALFAPGAQEEMNVTAMPVHRWVDWNISGHGTISILDARDAAQPASARGCCLLFRRRKIARSELAVRASVDSCQAHYCLIRSGDRCWGIGVSRAPCIPRSFAQGHPIDRHASK